MIKAKLSSLVKNQFPDFYQEEGQNFLAFIEAYYEYLEQNGKLTDAIQNLEDYKDINTTLDEYLDYFQDTLLPSVPHDVLGDKRVMAKYVKNFNIARGTEASYRLLFRAIYNEDIEISYPSEQMLKLSDGDWRLDRYLVTNYDTRAYELIGRTIQGRFSGARALVEDVVGRVVRSRDVMQIMVSNVVGKFEQNEPIKLNGEELTANTYSPKVEVGITSLDIINAGGEYRQGDVVELISDKAGDLGKVVVTGTVDLGGAITFDLKDGGSGYTSSANGPDQGETQVLVTGGDGQTPASFTVDLPDIGDRFAIYMNTDLIGKPTIFGEEAARLNYPTTTFKDSNTGIMNTFANTLLGSPNYGFQEQNEIETNQDFFTNANAVIVVANTKAIPLNSSFYGSATGANAHVTSILVGTDGAAVLKVNTYKNFTSSIHNYFSDSEYIQNGNHWVSSFSDISDPNIIIAPDGSQTAENLIEDTTTVAQNSAVTHYLGVKTSAISHTTTDTWNFSCYARAISAGSKRWLGFRGMGVGSSNKYPVFDVADGVVADAGDGTTWTNIQMEAVGGGWYRCSASVQPTSASTAFRFTLLQVGNNNNAQSFNYDGDGTSGLSIWGAQQSLGAAAKPYQRTTDITENGQGDGEYLHFGDSEAGANLGVVTSFSSNAVGRHILDIGVTDGVVISEGDEFVSVNTNEAGNYSFGVVKKIISQSADAYTHDPAGTAEVRDLYSVLISANSTSQLTNQFDIGPIVPFREEDGIKIVGSSTVIANVATAAYTSNTNVENIHMAIGDCIIFKETTFGTIENLSNRVGGSGFSVAPDVKLIEPNISTLGIGEQYVTLETDSDLTATTDSNDKLLQGPAIGDLKHVADSVQQPDGKWHTVVRCWQQFLQRDPGNIYYANNATATLEHYGSEYIPGTLDSRTADSSETVKIVKIVDEGVLGKNAVVDARVGADGTATGFRVIDAGFSYTQGERVRVKDSGRTNSTQAVVDLSLLGVANSQGYYATSRSHVSTKRGYIQDSKYYQEYSYQVVAPLAVERYRDIALKLVHPAGQSLFGKYQLHSNVNIDISTSRKNTTMVKSAGTISITQDSSSITGTDTTFESHFGTANSMIVEVSENNYINIPLNSVTNDTTATAKIAWNGDAISNAKIYYRTGEIT
jgi:hypothetical protein